VDVTKLRHAGSQVTAPEKLSKDTQDAHLLHGIVMARIVSRQRRCSHGHRIRLDSTIHEDLHAVRKALRLDDPVLDDIIASRAGQPWPWSSPVREAATMSRVAAKYGG
jgi:hypothetical protein